MPQGADNAVLELFPRFRASPFLHLARSHIVSVVIADFHRSVFGIYPYVKVGKERLAGVLREFFGSLPYGTLNGLY